jgi:hypothetical protein
VKVEVATFYKNRKSALPVRRIALCNDMLRGDLCVAYELEFTMFSFSWGQPG